MNIYFFHTCGMFSKSNVLAISLLASGESTLSTITESDTGESFFTLLSSHGDASWNKINKKLNK